MLTFFTLRRPKGGRLPKNPSLGAICRRLALPVVTACMLWQPSASTAAESVESVPSGPGLQVRGGHIEGQGVPQDQSLTPVELFPFYLMDGSLFFSDVRFYATNDLLYGGNIGLGYRYF